MSFVKADLLTRNQIVQENYEIIDRTTESNFANVYFDLSSKCYLTVPETASSDTGIMFTAGANDSSNSLLFLKPPPGSEIPRSASVSGALQRPRPQVDRDLQTESYEELYYC